MQLSATEREKEHQKPGRRARELALQLRVDALAESLYWVPSSHMAVIPVPGDPNPLLLLQALYAHSTQKHMQAKGTWT